MMCNSRVSCNWGEGMGGAPPPKTDAPSMRHPPHLKMKPLI